MKFRIFILSTLAAIVFYAPPSFADNGTSEVCAAFSKTMTKNVIDIFHDEGSGADQKRENLAKLFGEAVDTDWIGKFVLGTYWKSASQEEQRQYLGLYKKYVTQMYVSKFDDDSARNIHDIVISSITPVNQGQFSVKSLIKHDGGDQDNHVDYLLDQSSGKCQVHDIIIENVSLLATHRSEFKAVADASGVKGVMDEIKKQLADD